MQKAKPGQSRFGKCVINSPIHSSNQKQPVGYDLKPKAN